MNQTACIFVDVDGTLLNGTTVNSRVADWIKEKSANAEIVLWSARGHAYAQKAAKKAGITDHLTAIVSKPTLICDDKGTQWLRFVRKTHPRSISRTPTTHD